MGAPSCRHKAELRLVLDGVHRIERHLLEISAVVAGRLQAIQCELRADVLRGNVAAARAWSAALQQIVCQKPHVRSNLFWINRRSCLAGRLGNSGHSRNGGLLRNNGEKEEK